MIHWTPSANKALDEYLERTRLSLKRAGADPDEVIDDLRRHIDEEIQKQSLSTVTEQDVVRLLNRIGAPDVETPSRDAPPVKKAPEKTAPVLAKRPGKAFMIFGIILPTITLVIELATHMCAGAFFDPIPTWWHVLLVALVPVSNLLIRQAVVHQRARYRTAFGWLNAFALGVALVYAVNFILLYPLAAIAVICFGWGLLPLSPLFAFFASFSSRKYLKNLGETSGPLPRLWPGMIAGIALLILLQLPASLTSIGIQMAASENQETRLRGVRLLRNYGDEELLLRRCYGRPRWAFNADLATMILMRNGSVPYEKTREIYFRVTGKPFNSKPAPKLFTARGNWNRMEREYTWDDDQGGDAVAGRVRGLSLVSSRQDAQIDADAAIAYTEWILEFQNDSNLQREARAQIALPPGGVVSRLTLWIDGEEREAAFAGRSQVKEAYKNVVHQRRDPVLVTTSGPDRILVQCFPVPPGGGRMKVRIGITAPLYLSSLDAGRYRMTHFLERNFTIPPGFRHHLWVDSKSRLTASADFLEARETDDGKKTIRGEITDTELGKPISGVRVARNPDSRNSWCSDTRSDTSQMIKQSIQVIQNANTPSGVVFVIDGSEGMDQYYAEIDEVLKTLPEGINVRILHAGDEVTEFENAETARGEIRSLAAVRSEGGCDNVPALDRAWDLAEEEMDPVIAWIHGPQPVLLSDVEGLKQKLFWQSRMLNLYDFPVQEGPNRILEAFNGSPAVVAVPRFGSITEDLAELISRWNVNRSTIHIARSRSKSGSAEDQQDHKADLHLARLWAFDEVLRLKNKRSFDEAARLAALYQLVTPVSGAVVLETNRQYEEAGLEPVASATVPAIPEPGTWTFMVIGFCLFLFSSRRKLRWNEPNSQ